MDGKIIKKILQFRIFFLDSIFFSKTIILSTKKKEKRNTLKIHVLNILKRNKKHINE